MSMYRVAEQRGLDPHTGEEVMAIANVTVTNALGFLPDGTEYRGRNWPSNSTLELAEVEAAPFVRSGLLVPVAMLGDASPGELKRAEESHASSVKRRDNDAAKLDGAQAELARAERAFETDGDKAYPAVEEARRNVARCELAFTQASKGEAQAAAALVEVQRRSAMTVRRNQLKLEAKRREQQAEKTDELLGLVRQLKSKLDEVSELNADGDVRELRTRVAHEVRILCAAMNVRPQEIGWVFQ